MGGTFVLHEAPNAAYVVLKMPVNSTPGTLEPSNNVEK
jgi:hypothetical protein